MTHGPAHHGLQERATGGLHAAAEALVATWSPGRALEVGCGSGAFAARLQARGWEVVAADRDPTVYAGRAPFVAVDLEDASWPETFGTSRFDLIVALEVIEHLYSPLALLRGAAQLLAPGGRLLFTTPNVESWLARLRFLVRGRLRMMDAYSDPTHVMPVFSWLLRDRWLPRAGLELVAWSTHPRRGSVSVRPALRPIVGLLARLFPARPPWQGDNHLFVCVRRADARAPIADGISEVTSGRGAPGPRGGGGSPRRPGGAPG